MITRTPRVPRGTAPGRVNRPQYEGKEGREGLDKFTRLKKLGHGSFGNVYQVRNETLPEDHPHRICVLKEVQYASIIQSYRDSEDQRSRNRYRSPAEKRKEEQKAKDEALREAMFMRKLHHPYIVRFFECFEGPAISKRGSGKKDSLYIVMEFAGGGTIADWILHRQRKKTSRTRGAPKSRFYGFPEKQVLCWAAQLFLALAQLHRRRILHRDVKSANVFLSADNQVKLGDFGVSKSLAHTLALAQTRIGTPYYLSPEVCLGKPYSYASDVWGVGVILWELLTLEYPFQAQSLNDLLSKISRHTPKLPLAARRCYSPALRDLVRILLRKKASERPTAEQVLQAPILREYVRRFDRPATPVAPVNPAPPQQEDTKSSVVAPSPQSQPLPPGPVTSTAGLRSAGRYRQQPVPTQPSQVPIYPSQPQPQQPSQPSQQPGAGGPQQPSLFAQLAARYGDIDGTGESGGGNGQAPNNNDYNSNNYGNNNYNNSNNNNVNDAGTSDNNSYNYNNYSNSYGNNRPPSGGQLPSVYANGNYSNSGSSGSRSGPRAPSGNQGMHAGGGYVNAGGRDGSVGRVPSRERQRRMAGGNNNASGYSNSSGGGGGYDGRNGYQPQPRSQPQPTPQSRYALLPLRQVVHRNPYVRGGASYVAGGANVWAGRAEVRGIQKGGVYASTPNLRQPMISQNAVRRRTPPAVAYRGGGPVSRSRGTRVREPNRVLQPGAVLPPMQMKRSSPSAPRQGGVGYYVPGSKARVASRGRNNTGRDGNVGGGNARMGAHVAGGMRPVRYRPFDYQTQARGYDGYQPVARGPPSGQPYGYLPQLQVPPGSDGVRKQKRRPVVRNIGYVRPSRYKGAGRPAWR